MSHLPPPTDPGPIDEPTAGEAPGATAGLILGVLSVILAFGCPLAGIVCAIIGFPKAKTAKHICDLNPGAYINAGSAQAGYAFGLVGLVLNVLALLGLCLYLVLVVGIFSAAAG